MKHNVGYMTSRFLTVDPAPGVLAEPQSLNRYVYSLNDPINKLDPSGQYTLIGLMVGVVILGILATTCASHVAHRNQTLLIDVEYWDNSRDEILGMFDVQSILNIGINQARAYFQPYDIEISRSSREPSDPRYEKQFSILGTCEGRGMACHLEWFGSSGDPPGAFLTNIVHYYLINKGFSPGADSEIGSFLGATIAHEAGHLYGLSHGHCEGSRYIMWTAEVCGEDENASRLEDEISGNLSWSPDSQEVLEEVLGLRH